MKRAVARMCVWYVMCVLMAGTGLCQDAGLDTRLFMRIHTASSPVLAHTLGFADRSAYPVIVMAVPSVWAASVLTSGFEVRNAGAVTASMVGAIGSAIVLKRILGRERPYHRFSTVHPREGFPGTRHLSPTASMPSGHAALASALVVSAMLIRPSVWTILPGSAWAGSVALSRIWLGVHYPSDVLVGSMLGAGVAVAVHLMVN